MINGLDLLDGPEPPMLYSTQGPLQEKPTVTPMTLDAPEWTVAALRRARERLGDFVRETPVWKWSGPDLDAHVGPETEVFLKLELFQHAGSFKPRGALSVMLDLDQEALRAGVTTVSAGNHAMAVAYGARVLSTHAKVVMPKTANPFRLERCRAEGAEVVLADDVYQAFDVARAIEQEEHRTFVHPFEGPQTALGNATLALELAEQVADLDAVVVAIGGGGLCAGVSAGMSLFEPGCHVYGVEPEGADTMSQAFAAGGPVRIAEVRTIADSLGAPYVGEMTFALCRRHVKQVVTVTDLELCQAMLRLFQGMKLAVEPAGAAALAALCGPLRERLRGKRVGLIVSGANIDQETFCRHLSAALAKPPNATW